MVRLDSGRCSVPNFTLPLSQLALPRNLACAEQVSHASGDGQRACSKKVNEISPNLWRCGVGHTCQTAVWRYLCKIEIRDHTGSAEVQLFDKQASVLFGCDAQHCAQAWNSDAKETIIREAMSKSVALRVRSQKEVWQEIERVKCIVDDIATPTVHESSHTIFKDVCRPVQ